MAKRVLARRSKAYDSSHLAYSPGKPSRVSVTQAEANGKGWGDVRMENDKPVLALRGWRLG